MQTLGHGFYVQVRFTASGEPWSGRKWYLSAHATDAEVVQTALKAVLTAVEHEAREAFTYQGVALFQPHCSLEELVQAARTTVERT